MIRVSFGDWPRAARSSHTGIAAVDPELSLAISRIRANAAAHKHQYSGLPLLFSVPSVGDWIRMGY